MGIMRNTATGGVGKTTIIRLAGSLLNFEGQRGFYRSYRRKRPPFKSRTVLYAAYMLPHTPSEGGQGQTASLKLLHSPRAASGMKILPTGPGTEALFAPARGPGRKGGVAPRAGVGLFHPSYRLSSKSVCNTGAQGLARSLSVFPFWGKS